MADDVLLLQPGPSGACVMQDGALRLGVASPTRFHMFDLAQQLNRLGQKTTLFAAYPRWKLDAELRIDARTRSRWLLLMAAFRNLRLPESGVGDKLFQDFTCWLGRVVKDSDLDLLDALDGVGLHAGRIMRERGKIWLCNRGSSHILHQREILRREYARWKASVPADCFVPQRVEQCLMEYREATGIVLPSAFTKKTFVDRGIRSERVHVCPYGVDLSLFRPQPKEDSVFRVIFAGTLCIRKGIGYLLEALKPLVAKKRVSLWCVGNIDAEARHILDAAAGVFVHKGLQPRSKLSWFYSQASVLVLPSVEEGLALVQAQAMACGVPVIATPNTGAEDLFTDGVEGFVVPACSANAIRERVEFLLDNPHTLEEMSAAALRRVRALDGWRHYGERCLSLYRSMLVPSSSRPAVAEIL